MTDALLAARGTRRFTRVVYFFGALGELMFGYDVGVIGVALLFISRELHLTPFAQGVVVSALLAGAAVGVGAAGVLADRFGRRPMLIATALVFSIGGLVGALAPSVAVLVAARVIMGAGVGASAVVVMIYLVELAPTSDRGRISALGQLMVVSGILLAYVVDYLLAPWGAWRWMIGFSVVPSIVLLIGLWFLPESPRWLVQVGRIGQARAILTRIGRSATADAEIAAMKESTTLETGQPTELAGRLKLFSDPGARRGLVAALGLAVFVQLLGVNTIIYYAPTILMQVGFGQNGAIIANLGIGVINVAVTALALSTIDRFGRRRLLLAGTVVMTLAMLALGAIGAFPLAGGAIAAWITLAAMLVFLASFAMSWGLCTRVVISELLPQRVRGTAMGLVLVLNWTANFCVGLLFPVMLAHLGQALTFLTFAAVGAVALGFVTWRVPETKGRTLEEIQSALRDA